MIPGTDHARELKLALGSPRSLCEKLGLTKDSTRQANDGITVLCPLHSERTPSCSVTHGDVGARFFCFGCKVGGDSLHLVAAVHGLDVASNFKEVLLAAAELVGRQDIVDEINGDKPYQKRELPKVSTPPPDRVYPAVSEVQSLWTGACPVTELEASKRLLEARALPAAEVARFDLARSITANQPLPRWASYQGQSWRTAGYRILVPMFDAAGEMRSVRAWRVEDSGGPKRLPPAGCRATGLVMANGWALTLLREKRGPRRVLICEGEPDALSATLRWPGIPVFGIISGSWGPDFAERIPLGSQVIIATHHDTAGDKYAEIVKATVKSRAQVVRSAA